MNTSLCTWSPHMLLACFFTIIASGQTVPPKEFGQQLTGFIPCGVAEHTQYLLQKGVSLPQSEFEQWLEPKTVDEKLKRWQKNSSGEDEIFIIPIVVHIIHNGDAQGMNENISDEQVISQITVLNQDFRRLEGTRGFNSNPNGADVGMEFRLAQRDPAGLRTTGIVRHDFTDIAQGGWQMAQIEEIVKPQTQWDPDRYLNIWVVDRIYHISGFPLAGYAQFPVQSGLEGLDYESLANTDGVVIAAPYFGSIEICPQGSYNSDAIFGRAAVHEIGHFFGLRHTWGDGDCSATDYCDDTPAASGPNTGCPNNKDSCDSPGYDMIQNFMDYTSDACKSVFTQNQRDRIMAVMAHSPRRTLLKSSIAWMPLDLADNDAVIEITGKTECGALWPEIKIRNTGNNVLSSAVFTYGLDDVTTEQYTWTGSLGYGEQEVIKLLPQSRGDGQHIIAASLTHVNAAVVPLEKSKREIYEFTVIPDFVADEVVITVTSPVINKAVYWNIYDINDVLVQRGAFESNRTAAWRVALPGGCYNFLLADVANQPVAFDFGYGSYQIRTDEGRIIAGGGELISANAVINFGISNISESGLSDSIKAYPNPVHDVLNIALSNSAAPDKYTVYNSFGQALFEEDVKGPSVIKIDTSAYNSGLYFIKFEKGKESATVKFIRN